MSAPVLVWQGKESRVVLVLSDVRRTPCYYVEILHTDAMGADAWVPADSVEHIPTELWQAAFPPAVVPM